MSEEELININGIREDLYQAMLIGDITLRSKDSQELYDFMNYQDKEIERLNNIINEIEKGIENMWVDNSGEDTWQYKEESWLCRKEFLDKIKELKGSDEE